MFRPEVEDIDDGEDGRADGGAFAKLLPGQKLGTGRRYGLPQKKQEESESEGNFTFSHNYILFLFI